MSETTLRAGIKTILDATTSIGMVYDYERWAKDWGSFIALFKDKTSGKIFGFEITRNGFKLEKITKKFKVTHNFVIKGYCGLQDGSASEKFFNAAVEAVMMNLLSSKITGEQGESYPEGGRIVPKMFGTILCHTTEIRIDVAEIVEKIEVTAEDLLKVGIEYFQDGDMARDPADASDEITI